MVLRESSFNMTRGDEDIEGGLQKFLDTRKGGSEKIRGGLQKFVYFKTNRRVGPAKKIGPLVRGAAKMSSFEFQYLHPPPPPLSY